MNDQILTLYQEYLKHPSITTDSRNTPEGSIFFALKGELFDGNTFALQALDNGCSLAVVDDPALQDKEACFLVNDVLRTLQDLAKHLRSQLTIPIIGITGSNGKTTTKELIAKVLEKKFNTYATKGNLNNHIGVPLSILSINKAHEIAVIEMGANHIGEIDFLCRIAQPTHGIITNIGKAHLEGFGSFEGVIKAKTELYRFLQEREHSTIFINTDNPILSEHCKGLNTFSYGQSKADCSFENVKAMPFVEMEWSTQKICSNLIGKYNAENIMAAICIGHFFHIEEDKIADAIKAYVPKNQRSEIVKTDRNVIILDAYNANPSSMKQALENFREMNKNNPLLILGDMFELGDFSLSEHQKTIELVNDLGFRNVVFVGEHFMRSKSGQDHVYLSSTKEAQDYLQKNKIVDHSILIKGSRGMELESLLPYL